MSKVCYTGPYTDATGTGEAVRNFCMSLVRVSVDLSTQNTPFTHKEFDAGLPTKVCKELEGKNKDYKIKIIHTTPDVYKNYMEKDKYNIGHLFWETNKLPAGWLEACNKMSEIWTGSQQAAQMLRDCGVAVPISVFPEPIDTNVPDVKPFILPNFSGFVFYSILDWKERKNPTKLLLSYWKEFKDVKDIALLLKVGAGDYDNNLEIINSIKAIKQKLGFKETPRTMVVNRLLSNDDKHRLHKTGTVFVSAHRGEGWGLPQVEAVLHNKMVISTACGGVHDYWKARHYKQVKYEMVPIKETVDKYYEKGMLWAEADENDLREKMRKAYEFWSNEKTKKLLGIPASVARNMVKNEFSYQAVGTLMKTRLEEIAK